MRATESNFLNPTTNERAVHIARLNLAEEEGIVAQMTGDPIKYSHEKREGNRSKSRD